MCHIRVDMYHMLVHGVPVYDGNQTPYTRQKYQEAVAAGVCWGSSTTGTAYILQNFLVHVIGSAQAWGSNICLAHLCSLNTL
ncbi:hypothetical protein GDO81_010146 [Engystomops pustulosus]|uniref:Uncharacterized protein n=1 Tax=Engystomops pustulosus TaxID=76066 RepID=A0AAV7BY43_ENGPU|nr:hypothetical protein GDO81_010146 [Engystomops pustulosus]